jgi:hypothetical protein
MVILGMFRMLSSSASPFLIIVAVMLAIWSSAAATIFFEAILEL